MKKKLFAALALSLTGAFGLLNTGAVFAATCPAGTVREGETYTNIVECGVPENPAGTSDDLQTTVNKIINVIIGIVGLVAVIVMIIGGIYFIISQGDAAKITRARNTILYGVVGLVIALLSFAIVNFVLTSVFNSSSSSSTTPPAEGGGASHSVMITPISEL